MSTRKRVEAYLEKWTGQGANPDNGCHIIYGELASHEDRGSCRTVFGWEIFIGDHQAGEVPNTVSYPLSSETLYPYRSDECFSAAAVVQTFTNQINPFEKHDNKSLLAILLFFTRAIAEGCGDSKIF